MFAAFGGLTVLGSSLLLFALLIGSSWVAPPISLGGVVYEFSPADLAPLVVPLVHLPLSMVLKIVCKTWLLVPEIMLGVIAAGFIIKGGVVLREVSPAVVASALSVSWAILVAVIFSYSYRRDLSPA